jgi:hypothetical protein
MNHVTDDYGRTVIATGASGSAETTGFCLPVVAGRLSSMRNADFERSCPVHIERLQHGYDSSMMATFCEAIRMVREYSYTMQGCTSDTNLRHGVSPQPPNAGWAFPASGKEK